MINRLIAVICAWLLGFLTTDVIEGMWRKKHTDDSN